MTIITHIREDFDTLEKDLGSPIAGGYDLLYGLYHITGFASEYYAPTLKPMSKSFLFREYDCIVLDTYNLEFSPIYIPH